MNEGVPLGDAAASALEVAPRVWWVGSVLADDPFQCHAYLVEAADHSVLIDPGSTLTIEDTLRKVRQVVALDMIDTVLVHHSDPDVCDGLHHLAEVLDRDRVRVVTEWRSALLMRHLALPFRFETIEDLGWNIALDESRAVRFCLTPYLHFPGAFVTFETSTRSLFSSDLFGGFSRTGNLWATSPVDFEDLRQFHEHYMPSRDILIAGLATIMQRFAPIERVLPQHGYLIPTDLVGSMFEQLSAIECGVMLASQSNTHLQRLLGVAAAVRHIGELLDTHRELVELLAAIETSLHVVIPIDSLRVETVRGDGPVICFDRHQPDGIELVDWTGADDRHLVIPIPSTGSQYQVVAVITTTEPFEVLPELGTMLTLVAGRIHNRVGEAFDHRDVLERELLLRTEANTDPLTGLLNRRALESWVAMPERAAVLMLDIDHFKLINDQFGHLTGDDTLRMVGAAIRAGLRRRDRAFRYGGEEFVVIVELEQGDELAQATSLAERVRANISDIDPERLGLDRPVTVSVGVDLLDSTATLAGHISRADAALYRAKASGRNRVETAAPPGPNAARGDAVP